MSALSQVGDASTESDGLTISSCSGLRSLDGLGQLESTPSLSLEQNDNLETLAGMALTVPPNTLRIRANPRITTLAPVIPPGAWDANSIVLERMPGITSLQDFSGLRSVTSLMISECDGLTDLTGLEQLKTALRIMIAQCAALTSMAGADNLTNVAGPLALWTNPALTSLRPLAALERVGLLTLQNNAMLPQCEVDWLAKRLSKEVPAGVNGPPGMCAP